VEKAYLALLRGVNVGRNNRVAMADLRALLTGLGCSSVRSHINSGNLLFTAEQADEDRLARRIETAMRKELGLTARCVVRSRDHLRRVVEANPLADVATDPARTLVIFLSAPPDPARLAALDPAEYAPDVFAAGERELYLWLPEGFQRARINQAVVEEALHEPAATARNWNTVTKLLGMLG
jgi:uncharacterized protein (DUF1697 family)